MTPGERVCPRSRADSLSRDGTESIVKIGLAIRLDSRITGYAQALYHVLQIVPVAVVYYYCSGEIHSCPLIQGNSEGDLLGSQKTKTPGTAQSS